MQKLLQIGEVIVSILKKGSYDPILFLNQTMKQSNFKCRCGYEADNNIQLFNHCISCKSKANWKGKIHSGHLFKYKILA
jgi:hypothetical protein